MEAIMASDKTLLIIGASRGLGLGLAKEYLKRGWHVIATVRDKNKQTKLHEIVQSHGKNLEIESIDINHPEDIKALHARLAKRKLDVLFVNAGIANDPGTPIGEITTDEYIRVNTTNALSPMRVVEALAELVLPGGVIAVMSSGLASIANNTSGGWEAYRASKAALNTLLRSFAARQSDKRTYLAVTPGWVKTDMGGANATLDVETSIHGVVDAVTGRTGKHGVYFIDHQNKDVPW